MLITLTIVGVIAALTIPNLLQKYQEQTTVKKVQKFYSNLSNAYSLAIKDNGPVIDWDLPNNYYNGAIKIYDLLFNPYFKIAKNCGNNNTDYCIANVKYKYLNNSNDTENYGTSSVYYKILLDDGAAIWWRMIANPVSITMYIFYDVNGPKEPNQWGKDLFEFSAQNDKIFPNGIPPGFNCKTTNQGYGCAAWLIYKGNMDYLHCDLTWNKNSCKDK